MPTSRKAPKSHDPQPPATLSPPARKLWAQIAFDYSITDAAALSQLSMALAHWDRAGQAAELIKRDGPLVDGMHGPRAHPMLSVEKDNRTAYLRALKALGLELIPPHDGPGRPPNEYGGY